MSSLGLIGCSFDALSPDNDLITLLSMFIVLLDTKRDIKEKSPILRAFLSDKRLLPFLDETTHIPSTQWSRFIMGRMCTIISSTIDWEKLEAGPKLMIKIASSLSAYCKSLTTNVAPNVVPGVVPNVINNLNDELPSVEIRKSTRKRKRTPSPVRQNKRITTAVIDEEPVKAINMDLNEEKEECEENEEGESDESWNLCPRMGARIEHHNESWTFTPYQLSHSSNELNAAAIANNIRISQTGSEKIKYPRWSAEDVKILKDLHNKGTPPEEIAQILNRTTTSVKSKISRV